MSISNKNLDFEHHPGSFSSHWNLHIVVVTHNRSQLLKNCVENLISIDKNLLSAIHIYDNASVDDTWSVIEELMKRDNRIISTHLNENIGGAGGFSKGLQEAFNSGAEWIGIMDDDLLLDKNCLSTIKKTIHSDNHKCFTVVREDLQGNLAEYAALSYNLSNPLIINPRIKSVIDVYKDRSSCPKLFNIACASFEGFFIHRDVIKEVGFPYAEYFIFGDDYDYSIRIREAGFSIVAVRDAKAYRMLPFVKSKFGSWKDYYRWRNFFIIHFLYGKNILVRLKPYILFVGLYLFCRIKKKTLNPVKVLFDARDLATKLKK